MYFSVKLQNFFTSKLYHLSISAVILLNCLVLGAETTHFGKGEYKSVLKFIDELCLIIFTIELALRIVAFKFSFFTGKEKGWNLFDFIIVAISLFGTSGSSVLRAYRWFCGAEFSSRHYRREHKRDKRKKELKFNFTLDKVL